jgi:adenylate cyclase
VSADQIERRLAAIFAADVEGYSRLMGLDEVGTLRTLTAYRAIIDGLIAQHRGRIFNAAGDSVLAEFPSVVDAVQCAISAQQALGEENGKRLSDQQMRFRIGVHAGDVLVQGVNLYGDGVNIAARLETLAEPGSICVSGSVRDYVGKKLPVVFTDCGEQTVKNIAEPVRAYRIGPSAAVPIGATERTPLPLSLPNKPSVAVLPFQNISGDPEQEYLADGMVEEITAALSRVRSFFVIARNSTLTYKGRAVDVKQVSRELGVRYVLEGSVRKASDRVRIAAQLIDATTGHHIWSDRYDGSSQDIFDLQDRITERVVGAIQPSILLAEIERTKRKRPESLDAYDYVLRALPHVWALDPTANEAALNHLNRAIEIEPDFPLALSLAAWCHARQVGCIWTTAPDETKAEASRLAKLAGGMSNDDPMVLAMLCATHSVVSDFGMASTLIDKALALDPNCAWAWNRSGWVNSFLIRPDVSIEQFQRAIRLSPFGPLNSDCLIGIGCSHWVAERYEEALSWLRKGMLERPASVWALRIVAACLGQLGRISEAHEVVRQCREAHPGMTISNVMAHTAHRDAAFLRRYAEGLRKAGLPE